MSAVMENTAKNQEIEKEKECVDRISIHTNRAEKNISTTGNRIK
jgi:hypothetical protein